MNSRRRLWRGLSDRSGAAAIEYALMASLISLCLIVGLNGSSARIQTVLGEVSSALGSPSCGGGGGPLPLGIKGC